VNIETDIKMLINILLMAKISIHTGNKEKAVALDCFCGANECSTTAGCSLDTL